MKILLSILVVYVLGSFAFLSYHLDKVFLKEYGHLTLVEAMQQWLLYLILFDLIIRNLMQSFKGVNFKPYLIKPIPRKVISNFVLIKSYFSLFNLLIPVLLGVFIGKLILYYEDEYVGILTLQLLGITLFNHSLNLLLNVKSLKNDILGVIGLGVLLIVAAFGVYQHPILLEISPVIFGNGLFSFIALMLLSIVFYLISFVTLNKGLYLDFFQQKSSEAKEYGFWSSIAGSSVAGELLVTELKLIFRNKRTKPILFTMPIFLVYGVIFSNDPERLDAMLPFITFFTVVMPTMSYSQFLISWEGSYFDMLMVRKLPLEDYFEAKYRLIMVFSVVAFCFSCLLSFILSWKIIVVAAAMMIYNIGINTIISFYFALYNKTKVDLDSQGWMNMNNAQGHHFLIGFIIMLPVGLIVAPFVVWELPFYWYATALVGIGLIGLALKNQIVKDLALKFAERKHKTLLNFRK